MRIGLVALSAVLLASPPPPRTPDGDHPPAALSTVHRVSFAIVRGSSVIVPTYDHPWFNASGAGPWVVTRADWSADGVTAVEDLTAYVFATGGDMGAQITVRSTLPAHYWTAPGSHIDIDVYDDNGPEGTAVIDLRAIPDFLVTNGMIADEVAIDASANLSFTHTVAVAPAALPRLRFVPGTGRIDLPVSYTAWPTAADDLAFTYTIAMHDAMNAMNDCTATFTNAHVSVRRLGTSTGALAGFHWIAGRDATMAESAIDMPLPTGASARASVSGLSAAASVTFDAQMRMAANPAFTALGTDAFADLVIDFGGSRPTLRGAFEFESVDLASTLSAAALSPATIDPGAGRYTYVGASFGASTSGLAVHGGLGTTSLSVSWPGSLVAEVVPLDLAVRRATPGYPEEHAATTLTISHTIDGGTFADAGASDAAVPIDASARDAAATIDAATVDAASIDAAGPTDAGGRPTDATCAPPPPTSGCTAGGPHHGGAGWVALTALAMLAVMRRRFVR